jgi:hypothetical protein
VMLTEFAPLSVNVVLLFAPSNSTASFMLP